MIGKLLHATVLVAGAIFLTYLAMCAWPIAGGVAAAILALLMPLMPVIVPVLLIFAVASRL